MTPCPLLQTLSDESLSLNSSESFAVIPSTRPLPLGRTFTSGSPRRPARMSSLSARSPSPPPTHQQGFRTTPLSSDAKLQPKPVPQILSLQPFPPPPLPQHFAPLESVGAKPRPIPQPGQIVRLAPSHPCPDRASPVTLLPAPCSVLPAPCPRLLRNWPQAASMRSPLR